MIHHKPIMNFLDLQLLNRVTLKINFNLPGWFTTCHPAIMVRPNHHYLRPNEARNKVVAVLYLELTISQKAHMSMNRKEKRRIKQGKFKLH